MPEKERYRSPNGGHRACSARCRAENVSCSTEVRFHYFQGTPKNYRQVKHVAESSNRYETPCNYHNHVATTLRKISPSSYYHAPRDLENFNLISTTMRQLHLVNFNLLSTTTRRRHLENFILLPSTTRQLHLENINLLSTTMHCRT
jgi:hypothetical protein